MNNKKILRFLWNNFITGIVVILPAAITLFILRFLVVTLNNIMLNPIALRLRPYLLQEEMRFFLAKLVVFLAAILIIVFIGVMTRVIFIRRAFSFFEKFLYKLPMVNKIYGATKEISNAFLGDKKGSFKSVVLVEYPRKGVYSIGFVTSETSGCMQNAIGKTDLVSVYIPMTPNPTNGLFVMVQKEEVIPLDISIEEALKLVISGGVITPHREVFPPLQGKKK